MKGKERELPKFFSLYSKVPRGFFALGNVSIGLMLVIVFVDVFLRYVFSKPLHWSDEVTAVMLVFVTFSAAAEVSRGNHHIACDILYCRFSERVRRRMDTFIDLCIVGFTVLIGWQGFKAFMMAYKMNLRIPSIIGVPFYLLYSFIFVGFVLLGLQSLVKLIERGWK